MTIYCGYFNAVDGDRVYTADDMTKPYELLVSNGVFATPAGTPSNYLQVFADEGMRIRIAAGRGLFFNKWFVSDANEYRTISNAEVTLKRIDSVIVKIDKSESVREASIYIKKGTPASSPTAPALERTGLIYEYRLANITVDPNVTAITQAKIQDRRPNIDDCGWITSLVQQADTSTLWAQFEDGFNTWFATTNSEYNAWLTATNTKFEAWLDGSNTKFEAWLDESNTEYKTWFNSIKDEVASKTLIRAYTNYYVTVSQDERVIPIGINQYNHNIDILLVNINGLWLTRDLNYTNTNSENITLTYGVDIGTEIAFTVFKSIDGSDAESVVGLIEELQNDVANLETVTADTNTALDELLGTLDITKVVSNTGGAKVIVEAGISCLNAFLGAGLGFHTVYVPNSALDLPKTGLAYRMFGHRNTEGYGWIIAMGDDGSVFSNYYSNSVWRGWKTLHDVNPTALWLSAGGLVMNENQTVTPSKKLSDCRTGWCLHWGDNGSDVTADGNITFIPKRNNKNQVWNGEGMLLGIPNYGNADGKPTISMKQIYITDTTVTGGTRNQVTDTSADIHLFMITEY